MRAIGFAVAIAIGLRISPSLTFRETAGSTAVVAQPSCTIADTDLFPMRSIDNSQCGLEGFGDAKKEAQNRAKNNLCAGGFLTANPTEGPALATQLTFERLQQAADEIRQDHQLGPHTLPDDRSNLRGNIHTTSEGDELGEGSLVRYVGFLVEGHFSKAEDVNCDRAGQQNFDMHLAFSKTKPSLTITKAQGEALECRSMTAEIIPLRRPDAWTLLGSMRKTSAKGLRAAIEKIDDQDLRRPIRLTGHLFFDASHQACRDGHPVGTNPPRASNWEIHPVYAIDVCSRTTLAACKWNNEGVWKPLHKWLEEEN